jgi:hypothetical protein
MIKILKTYTCPKVFKIVNGTIGGLPFIARSVYISNALFQEISVWTEIEVSTIPY